MPQIERVTLTDERRQQLESVNIKVNADTRYVTDQEQYGVPEYWEVARGKGDCEDYALAKMKMLRSLDWPQASLDIAVCKVEGQGHAVLIAHTDQGDMVLDNNSDDVLPWERVHYQWIEMSVGGSFRDWAQISV